MYNVLCIKKKKTLKLKNQIYYRNIPDEKSGKVSVFYLYVNDTKAFID